MNILSAELISDELHEYLDELEIPTAESDTETVELLMSLSN